MGSEDNNPTQTRESSWRCRFPFSPSCSLPFHSRLLLQCLLLTTPQLLPTAMNTKTTRPALPGGLLTKSQLALQSHDCCLFPGRQGQPTQDAGGFHTAQWSESLHLVPGPSRFQITDFNSKASKKKVLMWTCSTVGQCYSWSYVPKC